MSSNDVFLPSGAGGVFQVLVFFRANDIVDGLSTTAAFSERLVGSGQEGSWDRRRDFWYTELDQTRNLTSDDELAEVCASLTARQPLVEVRMGQHWMVGSYSDTLYNPDTLYNHVAPPNWSSMDCSACSHELAIDPGVYSARSLHSNMVHILFLDGSVRPVGNSVQLTLWRALASKSGIEAISLDSL